MESQYQQQQEFTVVSYFQPIHSDLSYECYDDEATISQELFNKSIFRQVEDDGLGSPPTVSRANPIGMDEDDDDDDNSRCFDDVFHVITPYPYSPCQEELRERRHFESEIPSFANLSSLVDAREVIDYSFYFETSLMEQPQLLSESAISKSCSSHAGLCLNEMRDINSPTPISDTESLGDGN